MPLAAPGDEHRLPAKYSVSPLRHAATIPAVRRPTASNYRASRPTARAATAARAPGPGGRGHSRGRRGRVARQRERGGPRQGADQCREVVADRAGGPGCISASTIAARSDGSPRRIESDRDYRGSRRRCGGRHCTPSPRVVMGVHRGGATHHPFGELPPASPRGRGRERLGEFLELVGGLATMCASTEYLESK